MRKQNVLGIAALGLTAALTIGCSDDDDADDIVLDARITVIDTNHDLVVSVTEWNAAFRVFDVNGDTQIVLSEFRFNGAGFAIADINGDGIVTEAEWDATLALWDTNGDLVLDQVEFDPFL